MSTITMGSLAGGGARLLGPMLAQRLGYDYVDRLILTSVARHLGATVEALYQREERAPTMSERFSSAIQRILERSAVTGVGGDPYFGPSVAAFLTEEYEDLPQPIITSGHEVEDEQYIEAVRKVILDLGTSGNVVIVGRGSPFILRDMPNVLRIGLIADRKDRVVRIMERECISRDEAEKTIDARDQSRLYYFKRFFNIADPDDPKLYHLVLNTSVVDLNYASDMIVQAALSLEKGNLARKTGNPIENS